MGNYFITHIKISIWSVHNSPHYNTSDRQKLEFRDEFMLLISTERWAQPPGKGSYHLSKGRGLNEQDKKF